MDALGDAAVRHTRFEVRTLGTLADEVQVHRGVAGGDPLERVEQHVHALVLDQAGDRDDRGMVERDGARAFEQRVPGAVQRTILDTRTRPRGTPVDASDVAAPSLTAMIT